MLTKYKTLCDGIRPDAHYCCRRPSRRIVLSNAPALIGRLAGLGGGCASARREAVPLMLSISRLVTVVAAALCLRRASTKLKCGPHATKETFAGVARWYHRRAGLVQ